LRSTCPKASSNADKIYLQSLASAQDWFADLSGTAADLYKILYGGDAITGDVERATFNPIASTTLKLLRFKVGRWIQYVHHSALLNNGLGLFSIVGLSWLHHIRS
jgi:hypothetical protein